MLATTYFKFFCNTHTCYSQSKLSDFKGSVISASIAVSQQILAKTAQKVREVANCIFKEEPINKVVCSESKSKEKEEGLSLSITFKCATSLICSQTK